MLTTKGLMKLMTWLSPSFPVGAYTYSHGLEYAVEEGLITNGESLRTWIEGALLYGAGHMDGVFLSEAWRLAHQGDQEGLLALNHQARTLRASQEMALESEAQGRAFLSTLLDLSPSGPHHDFARALKENGHHANYPVIVGAAAAFEEIELKETLIAYLHSFGANLVSAGVRLVPLGQTEGQKALIGLERPIEETADGALTTDLADIGSSAPVIDWTSMKHETQYTRLFRS